MNILILILGMLSAFGPLSIDMYLPALPIIATDFNAPLSSVQLSLASFFIGLALGQLFYGPVADRYGRKKPLYIGLIIYTLASFACATTTGVEGLVIFRFLQALGSCAGVVISRAVVRDRYHARDAAKIFSLLMLIMGVAPILAPLMGGYFSAIWGWRSIFWILTGVSSLTLVMVFVFLPETHASDSQIKIGDTFKNFKKILKSRTFTGYALSGGLAQAGMFAYITGSPFVFMNIFGLSPDHYAWLFGSNAFGLITLSQINRRVLKNFGPHRILSIIFPIVATFGLIVMSVGLLGGGMWALCGALFCFIATLGMTFPNSTASALAEQGAHAGSASALLGTLQYSISAIFSASVSHFHDGTMRPMTIIIGICGVSSLLVYKLVVPKGKTLPHGLC